LPWLIAELESRFDQLKASETDLKNLFYREQEARQVLEYDYKQLAYECDKHMELRLRRIVTSSTATNPCRS
jgi:hypothetical protein